MGLRPGTGEPKKRIGGVRAGFRLDQMKGPRAQGGQAQHSWWRPPKRNAWNLGGGYCERLAQGHLDDKHEAGKTPGVTGQREARRLWEAVGVP